MVAVRGRARTFKVGTVKVAIVGFAVGLALVAWVMALVLTDVDQEQQLRQTQARASNLALVFEEQIYRQILSVDQTLRTVKSDWERNPAGFDYTSLQRRALAVSNVLSQLVMLDSRGKVIAATRRDLTDADLSGRRYFQAQRNDANLGQLTTGPFQSNGSWLLNFSRRLNTDHGTFGGVVLAVYDLNALAQDMAQADLGPRGLMMLVGRDGLVRAISLRGVQEPGADIINTQLYRAMFQGSQQSWIGPSSPDGDVRIHSWRQIPGQDMALVVGLDRTASLGASEIRRRQALLGAAAITLLVMIMAGGVANMISAAASREQTLARDRAILEAANAQLAKARERADEKSMQLGMTIAGMSDGISMFDAGMRLVQWNDRYADLSGLPPAALRVGLPLEEVLRLQARQGEYGAVDVEAEIAARMARMQDPAEPPISLRTRPNGAVIEMRRTHLPDGGLVTLYTDITIRKRSEDAQSWAREQAEIAAQEKSRFVAIVSHEIRTPLNVALNALALLDRFDLGPAQRQLVNTGLLAGESLMSLLNDILDLSRMQAGRLQLRHAPFSVRPMLNGIVELFRLQAEERGVELSVDVAPGVPEQLMTDAGRLRQVMMNLVNNAAKFAEPGPASIRVRFATLDGEQVLRFAVRDRGPDIPDLDRARLFRPFSQLEQPGNAGSGLGLAICQLLANLLGGQIGCDNLPEGKEFWLTLPADVMDVLSAPAPVAAEAAPGRLPRTRILLVEDIPANQIIVATMLRREGHMVDVASSGLEALQKIDVNAYDVILLDIFMLGVDGLETARRIRAMPSLSRTLPIVALTANVSAEDKAAYIAAGMNDLVAKPIERATLLRTLALQVWSGRGSMVPSAILPPAVAAPATQILDLARIQSWRSGLPAEMCDTLFAECLHQLRDMLAPLRMALQLHDLPAVKQAAHAMGGVAGNYGLLSLESAIRAVAKQPTALEPDAQIARLDDEIDRAEQAIANLPQTEIA